MEAEAKGGLKTVACIYCLQHGITTRYPLGELCAVCMKRATSKAPAEITDEEILSVMKKYRDHFSQVKDTAYIFSPEKLIEAVRALLQYGKYTK